MKTYRISLQGLFQGDYQAATAYQAMEQWRKDYQAGMGFYPGLLAEVV